MISSFIGSLFAFFNLALPTDILTDSFSFPAPQKEEVERELSLWATEYHIHPSTYAANGYPLLDKDGQSLGGIKLSYNDWCAAALEGTAGVQMPDKKWIVINVDDIRGETTQVNCAARYPNLPENVKIAMGKTRYKFPQGPYGNGYDGLIINPYRSIAVDISIYPLRQLVYIPDARGVKFTTPSGEEIVHDGYFFTADKGGAIKGNHIDVFIGLSQKNPFPFIKSNASKTFKAYIVNSPDIHENLLQMHTPQIDTEESF